MWRKLGAFETAQAITAEKAVFNAVIVLCLDPLPEIGKIQNALAHLQKRHPLLRAGITRRHGKRWLAPGTHKIPLRVVPDTPRDGWKGEAERELNTPFESGMDPLIRLVLMRNESGRGEGTLIFCFHHLLIDTPSGVNLVKEFLEACTAKGMERSGPETLSSPLAAAEDHFPAKYRLPRGIGRLAAFFLRSVWDEITYSFTRVRSHRPPAEGKGRIIHFQMEESISLSLLRSCRSRGISFNNLAGAAMLLAVHQELYRSRPGRLRHITFSDLRPYLCPEREKSALGSIFTMLRLTIPIKPDPDLSDLAFTFQTRLQNSIRKGDKFHMTRMSKVMMTALFRMQRIRMATTALSYSGPVVLPRDLDTFQLRGMHVFVSNFPLGPEYTAQVRLFNNRLCWDILYLDCDMSEEKATAIAGRTRDLLINSFNEEK